MTIRHLAFVLLLVTLRAVAAEPCGGPENVGGSLATPDRSFRPSVFVGTAEHNPWLSRLRAPVAFAVLSLFRRGRFSTEPFEKVPLVSGQVEVARLSESTNLIVERVRFWSNQMTQPRYFLALVPKTPTRSETALILNHGWFDRPEDLVKYLQLDRVYGTLLDRGELRPTILIVPDVRFKSFRRVRRSIPLPDYLTLVAEEVVGVVSRRYGIPLERSRWAIGGFSFGGYMSLDIARRYPGQFASVSVISGLFDSKWTFWAPPPLVSNKSEGCESNETLVVPGPVPILFLACGTQDWLFTTMRTLHSRLERIGIPSEWVTGRGGHTWQYWASVLDQMLKFHIGLDQTMRLQSRSSRNDGCLSCR